jgi:decaprenyl-phosphate phosphoribosyltransferase
MRPSRGRAVPRAFSDDGTVGTDHVATGAATLAAATLPAVPRRSTAHAVLATLRPRQWIKNSLVIAAAAAAGALGHDDVPGRVTLACVAFCLLSSGTYALNDVRDAHEDRAHPRKRFRPVAAGELSPTSAIMLAAALLAIGLLLCALVRPLLAAVGAGYVGVTLSYTVLWRRIPVLDIGAIAAGFVLRALAGGVAAGVPLSRWFVLVVSSAAVFVAGGKRWAELRRRHDRGGVRRRVLDLYTDTRLRLVLYASAACTVFAYSVWAAELPIVDGVPWRPLSIAPLAACIVRYGERVRAGGGEAPEELLFSDPWLCILALMWLLLFGLGVDAAG